MILTTKLHRILAVLPLLVLSVAAHAQIVGGSISGLVKDSTGASLAGATVTVRQIETGATRILATNGDGRFYAPSVPVGDYLVSVAHDGFETGRQSGISLAIGQSLQLNFALGVEKSQQQIVVNAEQSSVNTTTQQTAGLINERAVKELPLNGRSYDELLTLNPATVNYTNERSGGIGTSNSSVGNMFAVSGRRPQDNLFLLNGIEYTGASLDQRHARRHQRPTCWAWMRCANSTWSPIPTARNTASAPAHRSASSRRPGTNQLHGAAFEFLRNSALDARNFFDQGTIPEFQRNEFGGALGGPIRKDKLFLFGNYEGFRQNWG